MSQVKINGITVNSVDRISGREASAYVSARSDNIPGGCSMTATYYGKLSDGTEEQIEAYTWEKIEDPKFYLRHAIRNIEAERK